MKKLFIILLIGIGVYAYVQYNPANTNLVVANNINNTVDNGGVTNNTANINNSNLNMLNLALFLLASTVQSAIIPLQTPESCKEA